MEKDIFYKKIRGRLGTLVEVRTLDERIIVGRLTAFSSDDGSVLLEDAYEGRKYIPSTYISGSAIAQINFFEESEAKEGLESRVKALLSMNPNLGIKDIAIILDVSPSAVEKIVKKLRRR